METVAVDGSSNTLWVERYEKLVLLYIDKVAFVKALIFPEFKGASHIPSKCQAIMFTNIFGVLLCVYVGAFADLEAL